MVFGRHRVVTFDLIPPASAAAGNAGQARRRERSESGELRSPREIHNVPLTGHFLMVLGSKREGRASANHTLNIGNGFSG
jgi:hypothetical protein